MAESKRNSVLLSAAIAGLMSATSVFAADMDPAKKAEKVEAEKIKPAASAADLKAVKNSATDPVGQCLGGNSCKGKSNCATATSGCSGQNTCKGKGYTEVRKSECQKLMKKDKKVKFQG